MQRRSFLTLSGAAALMPRLAFAGDMPVIESEISSPMNLCKAIRRPVRTWTQSLANEISLEKIDSEVTKIISHVAGRKPPFRVRYREGDVIVHGVQMSDLHMLIDGEYVQQSPSLSMEISLELKRHLSHGPNSSNFDYQPLLGYSDTWHGVTRDGSLVYEREADRWVSSHHRRSLRQFAEAAIPIEIRGQPGIWTGREAADAPLDRNKMVFLRQKNDEGFMTLIARDGGEFYWRPWLGEIQRTAA